MVDWEVVVVVIGVGVVFVLCVFVYYYLVICMDFVVFDFGGNYVGCYYFGDVGWCELFVDVFVS